MTIQIIDSHQWLTSHASSVHLGDSDFAKQRLQDLVADGSFRRYLDYRIPASEDAVPSQKLQRRVSEPRGLDPKVMQSTVDHLLPTNYPLLIQ